MLIGMPPGGLYESYMLFDNSMLTGTAQKWTEVEAAQEAAAAAEKLELFPEAAAEGSGGGGGAAAAAAGEGEEVKAATTPDKEEDKTGDDANEAGSGAKIAPRKAGAATA